MDISKRKRILERTVPEFLQGVLRVDVEDGELAFRHADRPDMTPFHNVSEAVAHVRARGLTGAQLMDSPYTSRNVPGFVRDLSDELAKSGKTVQRFQYNLADDYQLEQFEQIYRRDDQFYGLLTPDDTTTYLRAYHKSGQEMTHAELATFMRDKMGFVSQDPLAAMAAKRRKGFVVSKPFEATTDPMRIGIFDVTSQLELDSYHDYLKDFVNRNTDSMQAIMVDAKVSTPEDFINKRMREASDIAADGYSLGSMEFFDTMETETNKLRNTLSKQVKVAEGAGDIGEARELRRQVELLDQDLVKLRRAIDDNVTFNIRASGMRAIAVGDKDGKTSSAVRDAVAKMKKKGWTLKGNIQPDPSGYVSSRGVDILTHAANIKFEEGISEAIMGDRLRSYITLDPFYHSGDVIIDLQTIASNPEVFTRDFLSKMGDTHMKGMQETIKAAAEGRGVPPAFRATLESMADGSLDESVSPQNMRKARNILKTIDSGIPLSEDPYIMSQLLDVMEMASFKKKGDFEMPKLTIPGAQRGEITPRWGEVVRFGDDAPTLKPGNIRFDPKSGTFVMHEADIAIYRPSLGGFDLDDALNGIYRYDADSGQIRLLGIRQPNSRYEQINLNLSASDDFIMQAVGRAKKLDAYKGAMEIIDGLQAHNVELMSGLDSDSDEVRRLVDVNNAEIQKYQLRINSMIEESVGSFKEIARSSGGIRGEPIPMTRTDDAGRIIHGHTYEMADGRESGLFFERLEEVERKKPHRSFSDIIDDPRYNKKYLDTLTEEFSRLDPKTRNAIGIWSNPRMVLDTWWGSNESLLSQVPELHSEFLNRLSLLEQETVIDVVRDVDVLTKRTDDMLSLMFEITARAKHAGVEDIGVDPALMRAKGKGSSQAREKGIEAANKLLGTDMSYGSLMLKSTDQRAIFSELERIAGGRTELVGDESVRVGYGIKDLVVDEREARVVQPDWIMEHQGVRNRGVTQDALDILKSYRLRGMDEAIDDLDVTIIRREAAQSVLEAVADTFTEGEAGERTYQAVMRAMQLAEEGKGLGLYKLEALRGIGDEGGLGVASRDWLYNRLVESGEMRPDLSADITEDIMKIQRKLTDTTLDDTVRGALEQQQARYVDEIDPRRVVATITSADAEEALGAVLRKRVPSMLDDILAGTDITSSMIEQIHRGIGVSGQDGMLELPEAVQASLDSSKGAHVSTQNNRVRGVMDPGLLITRRSGVQESLGGLLFEFSNTQNKKKKAAAAKDVREALLGFQTVMQDWAADDNMPDILRDYVLRSMERKPGTSYAASDPFIETMARAENTARRASKAAENNKMARGFMNMFNELKATRGGRGIMAGVAGLGAIGLLDMVRKKDRTINEMQGPAFLPGGNPYAEDPNAHGSSVPMSMEVAFPEYDPQSTESGVMYQVRTRGGRYDDNFANEVQNITGGDVTGTIYDDSAPFQSADVREQILRMYG